MNLFTFVLSLALVAPARSIAVVEPDSGSVTFATAEPPFLAPEDALAILMIEHQVSFPIQILEVTD